MTNYNDQKKQKQNKDEQNNNNNWIDTSKDKLVKSHTRRPGHCLERETESLLIVAHNNPIRTNHAKAKID